MIGRSGRCLKQRRHLSSVERSNTRIAVTRYEENGGVFRSLFYVLIRRIGVQPDKLLGIVRTAVRGNPVGTFEEFLKSQHVEKWILTNHGPIQIRALCESDAHE